MEKSGLSIKLLNSLEDFISFEGNIIWYQITVPTQFPCGAYDVVRP